MYLYELPTTGAISISDVCLDQTADKLYTRVIPEITQARANLRTVLKEIKRTSTSQKDYLTLVKVIGEYLPNLLGLMNCITHDEIGVKQEPKFSWRTTLSANIFHNSPRIDFPGFHADYVFTLLTYAFAMSNLARSIVDSVGMYEHDRAIPPEERKAKDERLNVALDFLCKASGVFSYISETVLPEWETHRGSPPGFHKPPDISREVHNALAKMALAEAQTLAIRRLLSKSAYDSNIAPGPPLPSSHPPIALLAKLHIECASLYSSARTLVKTVGSAKSSTHESGNKEVSSELRRYLNQHAALHSALSHKWLGVDAGEKGGTSKGGEAVAFLAWAKKELEELKEGGFTSLGSSDRDKDDRWKARISEELASADLFYKYYKKMNDTLHFQPVPSQKELQNLVPSGRIAIQARPYKPPTAAFGPGTVEHERRRIEELEIMDGAATSIDGDRSPSPGQAPSYAGAGAYF